MDVSNERYSHSSPAVEERKWFRRSREQLHNNKTFGERSLGQQGDLSYEDDDDRTPFLDRESSRDQGTVQTRDKSDRRRCVSHLHSKKTILVGLLISISILILLSFAAWRLSDQGRRDSPHQSQNPQVLIHAKHGAVATELNICSEIGVKILKQGGNAVDAAIASGICIGSINMFSAGIGG